MFSKPSLGNQLIHEHFENGSQELYINVTGVIITKIGIVLVWYHGVQLATVVNMLSITVCMALAGFSWFCCRRNQRHVFISVCLSAVCSGKCFRFFEIFTTSK